jgi:membrane-associated phospholipid phosphatase
MALRGIAKAISIIFHPLLMLSYMTILLLIVTPYWFGANSISQKIPLLLAVFFSSFLIPAIAVLMMRFLGLVESLELRDQRERIGPYIVTGIFYLWLFINFRNDPNMPPPFPAFVLGSVIGLFLAFFINNFSKISAHTVGMGGLVGMLLLLPSLGSFDPIFFNLGPLGTMRTTLGALLLFAIVCAGLVGTSRLLLRAHEASDVYGGYLVGVASMFFAFRILL